AARARGISRLDTVNDAPENSKTDFGRHLDGSAAKLTLDTNVFQLVALAPNNPTARSGAPGPAVWPHFGPTANPVRRLLYPIPRPLPRAPRCHRRRRRHHPQLSVEGPLGTSNQLTGDFRTSDYVAAI